MTEKYSNAYLVCNDDVRYSLEDNTCSIVRTFLEDKLLTIYVPFHDEKLYQEVIHLANIPHFKLVKIPQTRYDEGFLFSSVMDEHLFHSQSDFVGSILYSFIRKGYCFDFPSIITKHKDSYDVFVFSPGPQLSILEEIQRHGENAPKLAEHLLRMLGIPKELLHEPIQIIYQNAWIANRQLFAGYCQFAKQAIHLLESDPTLKQLANSDSMYNRGYSHDKLISIYKVPFQTLHAFLMERLPSIYFRMHNARISVVNNEELKAPYCFR